MGVDTIWCCSVFKSQFSYVSGEYIYIYLLQIDIVRVVYKCRVCVSSRKLTISCSIQIFTISKLRDLITTHGNPAINQTFKTCTSVGVDIHAFID
jgi:hypothetical protein